MPEVRLGILDSLIERRLLQLEIEKNRLFISNEALRDFISKIPSLQENGKFSMTRYETALRSQGMSQQQFEVEVASGFDASAIG